MKSQALPRRVRAWYGLPGEIVIEGDQWHLVKVGPLPLPHPPLINRFIRRGLPAEEHLRLSYRHELGHLQTLPLALGQIFWLWRRMRGGRKRSPASRALGVTAVVLGHEAFWELAAEAYVVLKTGPNYRRLYRRHRNPFLAIFWIGMAALTVVGSLPVLSRNRG